MTFFFPWGAQKKMKKVGSFLLSRFVFYKENFWEVAFWTTVASLLGALSTLFV